MGKGWESFSRLALASYSKRLFSKGRGRFRPEDGITSSGVRKHPLLVSTSNRKHLRSPGPKEDICGKEKGRRERARTQLEKSWRWKKKGRGEGFLHPSEEKKEGCIRLSSEKAEPRKGDRERILSKDSEKRGGKERDLLKRKRKKKESLRGGEKKNTSVLSRWMQQQTHKEKKKKKKSTKHLGAREEGGQMARKEKRPCGPHRLNGNTQHAVEYALPSEGGTV